MKSKYTETKKAHPIFVMQKITRPAKKMAHSCKENIKKGYI